jgi:hypothetical protein
MFKPEKRKENDYVLLVWEELLQANQKTAKVKTVPFKGADSKHNNHSQVPADATELRNS